MPKNITGPELDEVRRKAREWLRSPEGQARITEIAANATAAKKRLDKLRRVDPERLRKPMTI